MEKKLKNEQNKFQNLSKTKWNNVLYSTIDNIILDSEEELIYEKENYYRKI